MSYTTPTTFVDDDVLTAAALNTLSTAITELQSVGESPAAVFLQRTTTSTSGTTFYAKLRHAHRYLWWRVDFGAGGQGDDMTLTIYPESGGSQVLFSDSSPDDASYVEVDDLNGLVAAGEFYQIALYIKVNVAGTATWLYCEERSVAV